MSHEPAIEVKRLKKLYRGNGKAAPVLALDSIDLTIPRGSIFGLLGPNGAGKSTFINILAGLVRKTAGSAEIWGFDIIDNPRNARNSIGVVPQELFIDPFFTPFETLELQAGLYGVPKRERRTGDILRLVQLEDKAHVYSRTLSGGMKRRLLVAKAMVHAPPILVLDEPTAGVDIELRQQLWRSIKKLHASGTTIVLTTHYLEEAENLCDTIAIINHGRVVACEPTGALLARIDEKEIIFDLEAPLSETPALLKGYHLHFERPDRLVIHVNKSKTTVGEILENVSKAGLKIRDLSTNETDLEDIFLQLTRPNSGQDQAPSGGKIND
jgi:ABC-2 type transport system ATP-binding protein